MVFSDKLGNEFSFERKLLDIKKCNIRIVFVKLKHIFLNPSECLKLSILSVTQNQTSGEIVKMTTYF